MGICRKNKSNADAQMVPTRPANPVAFTEGDDAPSVMASPAAGLHATPSTETSTLREKVLFYASLLVLTAVSLWPIWATRFLPMQDYPQHLFLAQVIATYDDPSYNWKEFYRVDFGIGPYMLWYVAMKMLAGILNIEAAGKILFSLYILLISLLALVSRRLAPKGCLPWGALLLYPFAFNQMYFLGFPNYIISLPLIFLALLDLDSLSAGFSFGKILRHGLYLALLFLIHPYSLLVYIVLSATSAFFSGANRSQLLRALLPAAVMSMVFAIWYLAQHGPSSTPTSVPWAVYWLPPHLSLAHYLLQFTGMRLAHGADWLAVGIWSGVAVLFDVAWKRSDKEGVASRRFVAWYVACIAGIFVLPFWMGYYSYFSLRLAPVSYFALALLLCCIRVPWRYGAVVAVCVLALLAQSIRLQKTLVLEAETVLPMVSATHRNSLILPLVYQSGSDAIDAHYFNEIHFHDADYYQLLVGGGANPTLFPNAMMPVQYQPGLRLPYPHKVTDFSWQEHGAYYDYVLVRQAPQEVYRELARSCDLVAKSGPWGLFRNRTARKIQNISYIRQQ